MKKQSHGQSTEQLSKVNIEMFDTDTNNQSKWQRTTTNPLSTS